VGVNTSQVSGSPNCNPLLTMNIDGLERSTGFSGASRLSTILLFFHELFPVLITKRSKRDHVSDGISDRRSIGKRAKKSLGCGRIQGKWMEWTTHVGHDGSLSDTSHGVLDILLDESTEPDILKPGGPGIGVGRTVFSKLDNLFAGIAKARDGKWKVK